MKKIYRNLSKVTLVAGFAQAYYGIWFEAVDPGRWLISMMVTVVLSMLLYAISEPY